MKNIYVLLADGFEEVEALTPVDVLRRAGLSVFLVSTTGAPFVTGSHHVSVKCDVFLNDVNPSESEMLILPGGIPGATNLLANEKVKNLVSSFNENDKWLGAICAGPMVLGDLQLLQGKRVTCYPGFEKYLHGAKITAEPAVTDGKIITGRGIGAAMAFSLEIVRNLLGREVATDLAKKMVVG